MSTNNNAFYKRIFVFWIIIILLASFTAALAYLTTQQSLRLGANKIPSQLAVETILKLEQGKTPEEVLPAEKTDISKSLSPFIIIYDNNKNLVSASATISGAQPNYPTDILKNVSTTKQSRVTWQPKEGLRYATVALKSGSGYVVTGESLTQTEDIISNLGKLVLLSWLSFAVFSAFGLALLYQVMFKTEK